MHLGPALTPPSLDNIQHLYCLSLIPRESPECSLSKRGEELYNVMALGTKDLLKLLETLQLSQPLGEDVPLSVQWGGGSWWEGWSLWSSGEGGPGGPNGEGGPRGP